MGENNQEYIRKHVDTIILRTLLESDSYGYDILKEIDTKSNGLYTIKQPTLYNSLKRLEKIGYISSYEGDISNGGKRRYYSLTDLGKKVLEQETADWEFSRTLMSRLLSDKEYDLDNPPPFNPSELRPMTKRNVVVTDNPASTNYIPATPPISRNNDNVARDITPQIAFDIPRPVSEAPAPLVNIERQESIIKKPYTFDSDSKPETDINNYKNTKGYQLLYGTKPIEEFKAKDSVKEIEIPLEKPQEIIKPQQLSINDALAEPIKQSYQHSTPSYPEYNNAYRTSTPSYPEYKPAPLNDKSNTEARQKLGLYPENKEASNVVVSRQKEQIIDERPIEGLQLSSRQVKKTRREVEPLQPRDLRENEVFTNNAQYRPALDELFNNSGRNSEPASTVRDKSYESSASSYSFNSLQTKYKTEGFKLRPYNKTNTTSYYLTNFIYNNQINRDCFTIMYLLIAVQIFSIYFFADGMINLGFNSYLTLACGLILVPISFWIVYAINPNKRIKANFNFKISILTSLMIFFNLLVVIVLAGFFGFKADITIVQSMILPIFIPTILIFNIPLSSLVYAMLYNSKQYHLQ